MQIRCLLSLPLILEWPNDLIGWIRQKLSKLWKHKSYHKVKRAKHSVNLNAEKCIFYVQKSVSRGKKFFSTRPNCCSWKCGCQKTWQFESKLLVSKSAPKLDPKVSLFKNSIKFADVFAEVMLYSRDRVLSWCYEGIYK